MTLSDKLAGKFIVFDGPDGSGKGTQIERLTRALEAEGLTVAYAQDPGGTEIGGRIREILLHADLLTDMDVRCETLLFMASRAQLVGEVIEPARAEGKVVLCDRFISATCAYQGAAGGDPGRIIELGRFAVGDTWPDLTLILDVPADEGLERSQQRRADTDAVPDDAMEARSLAFHRKVRELFLNLPADYPGHVEVIEAADSPEAVHDRIMETLQRVDL